MEIKKMTCIVCPNGCSLEVQVDEDEVTGVTGNLCLKGMIYAEKEVINPTRVVTSTVEVEDGALPRVSVKTEKDIPKSKVMECARALKDIKIKAPVHIGDVIVENIAGTRVNIVATVNVNKK